MQAAVHEQAAQPPTAALTNEAPAIAVDDLAAQLPDYTDFQVIGTGGMGTVYRARHRKLNRAVAVKALKPSLGSDPAFAERFLREAQALAQLDHPNIVKVFDFGELRNTLYLTMEFVDGINLRALLAADKLPYDEVLRIIPQVCEALQYAHGQGIVHRDIKPENILLDAKGRVRIADFGLAKLTAAAAPFRLTGTLQVMGTPHYMAPEQMERPQQVDHRADIFSLGVVLYEMLTGELPIGSFKRPSELGHAQAGVDPVVMRTLQKDPSERYQQARDMQTDLEGLRSAPRPTPPPPAPVKSTSTTSVILIVLLVLGGVAVFIFFLLFMLFAGMTPSPVEASRSSAEPIPVVVCENEQGLRNIMFMEATCHGDQKAVERFLA